jgi:hypothetical protein
MNEGRIEWELTGLRLARREIPGIPYTWIDHNETVIGP